MRNLFHLGAVLLACGLLTAAPGTVWCAKKPPPKQVVVQKKQGKPQLAQKKTGASKNTSRAVVKAPATKKSAVKPPSTKGATRGSGASRPALKSSNSRGSSSAKTPAVKGAKGRTAAGKQAADRSASRTISSRKSASESAATGAAKAAERKSTASLPPSIRLKQEELERVRNEIHEYEKRLAKSKAAERSTLERLDDMDRQSTLIRTLVSHLNVQIQENEQDIMSTITQLHTAEQQLAQLKSTYSRSVIAAYKRGRLHDTELLLSSSSLNLMFIRSRYLRAFTTRQKMQAVHISEQRESITSHKVALEDKLNRQQKSVEEKTREENVLKQRAEEHKQLLTKVRQDNAEYMEQIRRKQAAASKIERLVADLIDRERAKRLAAMSRKKRSDSPVADSDTRTLGRKLDTKITSLPSKPISETAFGRLKGRLPWPVPRGAVVGGFGEQLNKRLGTVTISNGIDIEAPSGSPVRAVADGSVSTVYFIPGYGNLVILSHDDDFFTVYAHLSEIRVHVDQKVKAGTVIASSGEGIVGPQIHFEVWRERAKQNPLNWLSAR